MPRTRPFWLESPRFSSSLAALTLVIVVPSWAAWFLALGVKLRYLLLGVYLSVIWCTTSEIDLSAERALFDAAGLCLESDWLREEENSRTERI